MALTSLELLKFNLQENKYPYFSDEELQVLLDKNNGDVNLASVEGCELKAVNDSVNLGKLQTPDNSNYWLRLANRYRPAKKIKMLRTDGT